MKRISVFLFFVSIVFIFFSCSGASVPNPDPDPVEAEISVASATTATPDLWYNVDGNTVTWNSDAYDGPVDIFIVSTDATGLSMQLADNTDNSGSWTNEWWLYDPVQTNPVTSLPMEYLTIHANYLGLDLISEGTYRIRITDGVTVHTSDIFTLSDASLLARSYGYISIEPLLDASVDTLKITNNSPWRYYLNGCYLRGASLLQASAVPTMVLEAADFTLSTDTYDTLLTVDFFGAGETSINLVNFEWDILATLTL